jgi:hypothetical protein
MGLVAASSFDLLGKSSAANAPRSMGLVAASSFDLLGKSSAAAAPCSVGIVAASGFDLLGLSSAAADPCSVDLVATSSVVLLGKSSAAAAPCSVDLVAASSFDLLGTSHTAAAPSSMDLVASSSFDKHRLPSAPATKGSDSDPSPQIPDEVKLADLRKIDNTITDICASSPCPDRPQQEEIWPDSEGGASSFILPPARAELVCSPACVNRPPLEHLKALTDEVFSVVSPPNCAWSVMGGDTSPFV